MAATEIRFTEEPASRTRQLPFAVTTERVLFILFVGGLAWVPFWFGSNRFIAWGINAVLFASLAAIYEISLLLRLLPHPVALRRVRFSVVMFSLVLVWTLVQLGTWTPAGWHHPIWELASDALGEHLPGRITIDPDLTSIALLRLLTAASVFWLALQLCADDEKARWLIWSTIGICAVYAVVGIVALAFMPNGRIFSDLAPTKLVTSTFVNHNHYVTFAGIGLIAAAATILRLYRRSLSQSGDSWHLKIAALINTTGNRAALPLALASVILFALMLTGSRGGIAATALGLFALFVLNVGRSKARNEILILSFAVLLAAAGLIAFGDTFVGSILQRGLSDQGRPAVLSLTIGSIRTAPVLGFGYGTFSSAFPMFRDDTLNIAGFWDKAHNTYIEIFQGLGLLFGTMLIACVAGLVWTCLKGSRTRKRNATFATIAVSVSLLIGAHALLDFSLQIQAVTLTYMAILGAGVAQAFDPPRIESGSQRNR